MREFFDNHKALKNDGRAILSAKREASKNAIKMPEKNTGKTRREFLKDLGIAVTALSVITSGGSMDITARKENNHIREVEDSITSDEIAELKRKLHTENIAEHKEDIDDYTFLNEIKHPRLVDTGILEGKNFADLYATYLGIPSGSSVPEKINVDFKANLARLWRQKFGFDINGKTQKEERTTREKFFHKHKDLMNLAESLYSSYSPEKSERVSLTEYAKEITKVSNNSHRVFMHTMYALRHDKDFPRSRRNIIEKLAGHIGFEKLLACSLTEIMPSPHGETNVSVLDFLLRNAGKEFINRIPSVHDMLASFGPYQLTPILFAPGGSGSLAEKIEKRLPHDFIPKSVNDVSGDAHHRVAYITAIEHIAHLAGKFSQNELVKVNYRLERTAPDILHKEILTFIAMSHHRPTEAYTYFKHVFMNKSGHGTHSVEKMIRKIHNRGLRQYAHKALANYDFLSTKGAVASV